MCFYDDPDEGHKPKRISLTIKLFYILVASVAGVLTSSDFFPSSCTLEVSDVVPETPPWVDDVVRGKVMGSSKVITRHPEGNMNVYAKFHGNPSSSWGISLKTTNKNLCEPGGTGGKVRGQLSH